MTCAMFGVVDGTIGGVIGGTLAWLTIRAWRAWWVRRTLRYLREKQVWDVNP